MAFKPPLEQGELHSRNFRSVRDWIERNKGQIKAKPNQTVLYSGNDYDFDFKKGMTEQEMKEVEGTPMWKRLQQMRKTMCDRRVPCAFQTLEEVLMTIKHYPAVVDKDHQDQNFNNAHDFFDSLETSSRLSPLVPDQKKLQNDCWKRLSELYAGNATGDIRILDGAAKDYGKLREDKVFIQKELTALLRNDRLSPAAKKLLEKKVSTYGDHFDRRYTMLIAQLREGKADLTRKQR